MKNLLSLAITLLICWNCPISSSAQFKYSLSGQLDSVADGTQLFLYKSFQRKNILLDSVIYKSGFHFDGKADELAYYSVRTRDQKLWIPFIIEEGNIQIIQKGKEHMIIAGRQNKLRKEAQELTADITDKLEELGRKNWHYLEVKDTLNFKKFKDSALLVQHLKFTKIDSFYLAKGNAYAGLSHLYDTRNLQTPKYVDSVFKKFSPQLQQHRLGQILKEYIKFASMPQAFTITQNDVNGKPLKIPIPNGNYMLLDFWASWCVPCRANTKIIRELHAKYAKSGLKIVSISADDNRDNWKKAILQDSMTWDNVSDLKGWDNEYAFKYGVRAYPTYIIVAPDGNILLKTINEIDKVEQKLKEVLK